MDPVAGDTHIENIRHLLVSFFSLVIKNLRDVQYLEQFLANCNNNELQSRIALAENNYIRQRKFQATTSQNAERPLEQLFYTFQDINSLVVFLAQIDIPSQMAQLQMTFLRKLIEFVQGVPLREALQAGQPHYHSLLSQADTFILPFLNNLNGILSFDQINYLFSHFHSFSESQYLLLLGLKEFIPSDLNLAMELLCVSSPDFSNVQHFDEDNLAYTPKPIQQSPLSYGQMPQIKQEVPLKLRIVTQPPEFIISKRNINKDNAFPTVEVIGQFARDENIQYGLQVKFIQCDTRIEFPERLDIGLKDVNGNPLDITRSLIKFEASKVLTFNKLKVTETSTKNDDSLYFLQFILFEVDTRTTQRREIDSVSSTAFKVFTHVSQINKLYIGTEPIIKELLPLYANPYVETKVVIIGENFSNSPTLRVRFGNTCVPAKYHGPKTLVCVTPSFHPRRQEEKVEVQVCNDFQDTKSFSNKLYFTFCYLGYAQPSIHQDMTHYGHTNSQEDSFGTRSTFDLSFGANTSLSGNINYQSSGEFSGAYISGYSSSVSSWDGEASGHSGTIHLSPNNSYNNFVMNNSFNPNNNFSMNNSFNTNNNFNSPTPAFNSNPNNNFGNFNNFNPANTYNFGNNHFGNNYGNNNFNPNPAVNNPNNLPK